MDTKKQSHINPDLLLRWTGMMQRCYDPKHSHYKNYGARGIGVCDRWQDYRNFSTDLGSVPKDMQIDRINNDKDYSPDNCVIVSRIENCNNKRNNRLVTFDGKTQSIAQWSRETGISPSTIRGRIVLRGWSAEDALTTKFITPISDPNSIVDLIQQGYKRAQIASMLGINDCSIASYMKKNGISMTAVRRSMEPTRECIENLVSQNLSRSEIATITGMDRNHLHRMLKRFGIKTNGWKSRK